MLRKANKALVDVALLVVFTLVWEHLHGHAEHAAEVVGWAFARSLLYNWLHTSAHHALHQGYHLAVHTAHKFSHHAERRAA